jgi:beta-lactamase superfamily II metal-dependent hydrolase
MADSVKIRMYNVGFGDAFMLTFPGQPRPRRVLIDCGSHSFGPGPRPMKDVVKKIIADATDDDGVSRIDVVVGTHRHQDHVSGFAQKAWSTVQVGEVWMPWTEHPKNKAAKKIRDAQSARAASLMLAMNRLNAAASVRGMVQNSMTNPCGAFCPRGAARRRSRRRRCRAYRSMC